MSATYVQPVLRPRFITTTCSRCPPVKQDEPKRASQQNHQTDADHEEGIAKVPVSFTRWVLRVEVTNCRRYFCICNALDGHSRFTVFPHHDVASCIGYAPTSMDSC